MKKYELLEIQAKAMRMVEGTDLDWEKCVRFRTSDGSWFTTTGDLSSLDINYQLAIAIVEGKLVFEGDELYIIDDKCFGYNEKCAVYKAHNIAGSPAKWSWNPPKPKTVTIELSREDALRLLDDYDGKGSEYVHRVYNACKEALK